MKSRVLISMVLFAGLSSEASAACSGLQITDATSTSETAIVTFTGGNPVSITVAGLTWAPNGNKTGAQVAAAFANLSNGAHPGPSNPSNPYTGNLTGWSSGPVQNTNQVKFTSASTGNVTNIALSGTPTAPTAVTTDGASTVTLNNLLSGKTVCVGSAGHWEAQEFHAAGGALIDWKKGASDPVDPTKQVGAWSISGTGTGTKVNYTYGSTTYSNVVWDHGNGTYSFCNNLGVETMGTIKTGQSACP